MRTASDLIEAKSRRQVFTIEPEASVLDAVVSMAQHDIGALVVVAQGRVAGVVTERDCARKVVLMSRSAADTRVRDVMTALATSVRPERTRAECMTLMTQERVRHLPVMDAGTLLGIVSMGDLVKDIISEQTFTIEQLEHYITGERS